MDDTFGSVDLGPKSWGTGQVQTQERLNKYLRFFVINIIIILFHQKLLDFQNIGLRIFKRMGQGFSKYWAKDFQNIGPRIFKILGQGFSKNWAKDFQNIGPRIFKILGQGFSKYWAKHVNLIIIYHSLLGGYTSVF